MREINLDYARAAQLKLAAYERALLILVGCGGTGSWLAPAVAKVVEGALRSSVPIQDWPTC